MLVVLLAACDSQPDFPGTKMSDYFPTDGTREATFVNDDPAVDWKLVVEKKPQTQNVDGRVLVTWEWYREDTFEVLGSVQTSTQDGDAVLVHAWSEGATGAPLTFDPPVALTDDTDRMRTGDQIVTDTTDSSGASWTFTATYVENTDCGNHYKDDWEDCAHVTIDDGDGDTMTGPFFAGEYWQVTSFGTAWMLPTGYGASQLWLLADHFYQSDEDAG